MTQITLFHISDLHFGAQDRVALDWFADTVARQRPDAVICTGDLTMRGTEREFAAAADYLAQLAAPVSVEPTVIDTPRAGDGAGDGGGLPLWAEMQVLLLLTYAVGITIGWTVWGRARSR